MCNMSFLLIILCFYFELTIPVYTLSWLDFQKINYVKSIAIAENHYRRKIYMENLAKIEEHNDKFRKGLVSYSLVMNEFGHLTEKEFMDKYTGLEYSEEDDTELNNVYYYNTPKYVTLPAVVDWRLRGAVNPVTAQYRCGCCYAHAAVGVIESHYKIKFKRTIYLSKQQLMDCGKKYKLYGCLKGSTRGALEYAVDIGLTTESRYPYEALNGSCRLVKQPIRVKLKSYKKIKERSVYDMEAAVAFEGPVTTSLTGLPLKFLSAKEILIGTWCIVDGTLLKKTHAVVVVGYNTTPEGLNYWIMKNSWGEYWGDHGYFYVERHKDDLCGLTNRSFIPYLK